MARMPRTALLTAALLLLFTADARSDHRVSVADPAGGARWTATQTAGEGGRTCVAIRRGTRAKGRTCVRLGGRTVFSYLVRTENDPDPRQSRTIFVVAFAPSVTRARLQTPGRARTYRRREGRPRLLLAVLAGRVERPTLTADVRRAGRTTRVVEGPPPAVQVADPLGGPAWRTRTVAASGDEVCVAWERVPPRFAPAPEPERGAARCGDPDAAVPVATAERVDGRLVVAGLVGAGVRSATLRTPQGDRPLALEAKTRAVLAVLPGDTDPAALRIVVRRGDDQVIERALEVAG